MKPLYDAVRLAVEKKNKGGGDGFDGKMYPI
jgi:hypothetical protein